MAAAGDVCFAFSERVRMKRFSEFSAGRKAVLFVASALLVGYVPLASGTFATALAAILFYPLQFLNKPVMPQGAFFAAAVAVVVIGAVALAGSAESILGEKDSHIIVVDEVAGFFVAMAFVPYDFAHLLAAFLLFRFFDIAKPPPIRRLQALPGGPGVVADDLVAGLYTCLILHGLRWVGWLG